MRRVLIPTDFSENAMNAVRYAFELFRHDPDTEYVLLNAYDIPRSGSTTMLVSITDILKKDSEEGLKKSIKEIEEIGHAGSLRTISKHGQLFEVIKELIKKEEYNVIIMGTLGAGGLKKVLLGSNASEIVKKVKIPVLIVPEKATFERTDKILFTTDFKPIRREKQIGRLRDFAKNIDAEILVLNIHKKHQELDLEKAMTNSGLEELLKGSRHTYHHRVGDDIIEGIDQFILENDIKIVAMILRQVGFIDSLFHKSLTRQMAMHTKIPMLALHD